MFKPSAVAATALLLPAMAAAAPAVNTPAPATAPTPPPLLYTVKQGDTLIDIGGRALLRPQDWQAVARINHVADPHHLPVGAVLAIPAALLKREPLTASIAAFSGQVSLDPGGAARIGGTVAAGSLVATGANSFVTLSLADGSRVTLPSQSRVRVAVLERVVIDGRLERRFELLSGRSDFSVTPRERAADRFLVKTPVAVAAVRGTEFRVAHDAASAHSVIDVIEGTVAGRAASAGDEVAVAAGSGEVLDATAGHIVALPPAPVLLAPGKVQDDEDVVFALAPGGGLKRHGQLARDAGFVDRFAEAETSSDELHFAGVGNGTLYLRLTAIDAEGVEGLPSEQEFVRFRNGLAAEAGALPGKPRRTRFRWQPSGEGSRSYDFVLAHDAALADRIIDAPGLTATEMTVSGLAPGTWYWRVTVTAIDGTRRHVRMLPVRMLTIAKRQP